MNFRFLLATIASLGLFYANVPPALADIFTFNLDNVRFSDGGTAIGSFSFDNTPLGCTGSGSCDYAVTNVSIVTSSSGPLGLNYGAPHHHLTREALTLNTRLRVLPNLTLQSLSDGRFKQLQVRPRAHAKAWSYLLPEGFLSFPTR
jgi:hypothetical protein